MNTRWKRKAAERKSCIAVINEFHVQLVGALVHYLTLNKYIGSVAFSKWAPSFGPPRRSEPVKPGERGTPATGTLLIRRSPLRNYKRRGCVLHNVLRSCTGTRTVDPPSGSQPVPEHNYRDRGFRGHHRSWPCSPEMDDPEVRRTFRMSRFSCLFQGRRTSPAEMGRQRLLLIGTTAPS